MPVQTYLKSNAHRTKGIISLPYMQKMKLYDVRLKKKKLYDIRLNISKKEAFVYSIEIFDEFFYIIFTIENLNFCIVSRKLYRRLLRALHEYENLDPRLNSLNFLSCSCLYYQQFTGDIFFI